MIVLDLDSRRINQWLSAFAMVCRVLALLYALVLVNFHPHPVVQAREAIIMTVWWATAGYTALLGVLLFTRAEVLRAPLFLLFDAIVCMGILIVADCGYRNVFSLYSMTPVLTTALSLPSAPTLWKRGVLLMLISALGSLGFALSLWLNGYTFTAVIEQREVDEVILRISTYPVLGLILGFVALLMVLWQRSVERMNTLQASAAIESERRRIAMDIHDSVLSRLTALSRRVEYAELLATDEPAAVRAELDHVAAMAADIHADIRWTVRALRDDPTQIRLYPVITSIIERFQYNTGLTVDFRRPAIEPALPFDTLRHVGYIVEEALINIWKHARATRGWIEVEQHEDTIQVVIGDDGVGFDPAVVASQPAGNQGWGLENIAERAAQVGGLSTIHSAPGQGTRVEITLPLPVAAGELSAGHTMLEDVWHQFGF